MSVFFQSTCQTTVRFSDIGSFTSRTDKFVDDTALKFCVRSFSFGLSVSVFKIVVFQA